MRLRRPKLHGFTLIELIVVIGIIAILAAIVIIAVNPARQFAKARDAQRANDVNAIYKALTQYSADPTHSLNNGLPSGITTNPTDICALATGCASGTIALTGSLAPTYITNLPKDPSVGTDADTGYRVFLDSNSKVVVDAPHGELKTVSTDPAASAAVTNFKPTSVANLAAWYDATAGVESNSAQHFVSTSGQYFNGTVNTNTSLSTAHFSLDFWIKPTDLSAVYAPAGQWTLYSTRGWLVYVLTNGTIALYNPSSTSDTGANRVTSSLTLTVGQWNHVTVTYDGTKPSNQMVNFYINGVHDPSQTVTGTISATIDTTSAPLWLGAWSYSSAHHYLNGDEDSVGIWYNYTLAAAEAATLYNGEQGLTFSDLASKGVTSPTVWYNCDDTSGNLSDSTGTESLAPSSSRPTIIAGIAQQAATDGSLVSAWLDQSGNNSTASQTTYANRPTYKANVWNGLPAISFPYNAFGYLENAALSSSQPFSIFVAYKYNTLTPSYYQQIYNDLGTSPVSLHSYNGYIVPNAGSAPNESAADTSWHTIGIVWNGASSTYQQDGSQATNQNFGSNPLNGLRIGNVNQTPPSAIYNMGGYIGELIIYNRALSSSEINQIMTYLKTKWGTP